MPLIYSVEQLIEGFHVTSYQTNFASHHTRDRHVGFLSAWHGIGNTTKWPVTFHLVHTTTPNYQSEKNISTHTVGGNFKSFCEVNQKFHRFFVVFLYTLTIQKETKQRGKIVHVKVRIASCKPSHTEALLKYFILFFWRDVIILTCVYKWYHMHKLQPTSRMGVHNDTYCRQCKGFSCIFL